jgi:hypothetical protein
MTDSLSKIAEKILQDPILLRRLNDRIYNIFLDEMRQARDRNPGGRS